ncbi:MAG: hypothetical protein EXR68_02630 [Dehalococcoidia bacterium]|nr:hypothetical protein [Dehalococcoidia bacterium]
MPLNTEDRAKIAKAFQETMPSIEQMFAIYTGKAGAPARFALGVYDASDAGANWAAGGDPEARAIAEHAIRTAEWVNNHTETARKKVRAALRSGQDTGNLVRAKAAFQEDEAPYPGACLAEVDGKPIAVATSGLRGTEDEPFSLLVIELLKRALTPPAPPA